MIPRSIVLVVEDSADCAATIEMALARVPGIELRILKSAEEALRGLGPAKLAAVITDIQLPGMDGLEFIASLRLDQALSGVPIIVISGDSDRTAPARALAAGATAFFSKPFSPIAVRQKLEALIDGR